MSEREFPILTNPKEYIPWDAIAPHEAQALRNHHQTLERLAERGGLSWVEAYAVLTDNHFMSVMFLTEKEAKEKVLALLPNQEWIVPVTWEACGFIKVKAESAENACRKVHDNPDKYPLPHESEYVDASYDISGDIEESTALTEIYTKDYNSGKWGQDLSF